MQKILILLHQCIILEHSDNYSRTSGSLWNYYRYKVNDAANAAIIGYTTTR